MAFYLVTITEHRASESGYTTSSDSLMLMESNTDEGRESRINIELKNWTTDQDCEVSVGGLEEIPKADYEVLEKYISKIT